MDYSLPDAQFFFGGYSTLYRCDQSRNGGAKCSLCVKIFHQNDFY